MKTRQKRTMRSKVRKVFAALLALTMAPTMLLSAAPPPEEWSELDLFPTMQVQSIAEESEDPGYIPDEYPAAVTNENTDPGFNNETLNEYPMTETNGSSDPNFNNDLTNENPLPGNNDNNDPGLYTGAYDEYFAGGPDQQPYPGYVGDPEYEYIGFLPAGGIPFSPFSTPVTITFDLNGGNHISGSLSQSGSAPFSTHQTLPTVSRPGYLFLGWEPTVHLSDATTSQTVVAQWEMLGLWDVEFNLAAFGAYLFQNVGEPSHFVKQRK